MVDFLDTVHARSRLIAPLAAARSSHSVPEFRRNTEDCEVRLSSQTREATKHGSAFAGPNLGEAPNSAQLPFSAVEPQIRLFNVYCLTKYPYKYYPISCRGDKSAWCRYLACTSA
jgi:hypothetical protein